MNTAEKYARVETEIELARAIISRCGRTAVLLQGVESGYEYIKFVRCRRWNCPICGKKGGTIHQSRKKRIYEFLENYGGVDKISIRQLVLTVPDHVRPLFTSKETIRHLIDTASRVIKKYFPGKPHMTYLHLFGDEKPGIPKKFNPHVNFHIIEKRGEKLFITPELLKQIKSAWLKSLSSLVCHIRDKVQDYSLTFYQAVGKYEIDEVDIFYSFQDQVEKICHRIKYMSRPCPGFADASTVVRLGLENLFYVALRGLRFLRTNDGDKSMKISDESSKDDLINDCSKQVKELLVWKGVVDMSPSMFAMLYAPHERTLIAEDLWVVHGGKPIKPNSEDYPF